jgi:hypothetical protein
MASPRRRGPVAVRPRPSPALTMPLSLLAHVPRRTRLVRNKPKGGHGVTHLESMQ